MDQRENIYNINVRVEKKDFTYVGDSFIYCHVTDEIGRKFEEKKTFEYG